MWLELADEYGLYLVDETNLETHGIRDEYPGNHADWTEACVARAQNMVHRDKNHASVVIWSLGNEAGGGSTFNAMHDWIRSYDTTRVIQYEGDDRPGISDIRSEMYDSPSRVEARAKDASDTRPYVMIEYSHAMGNSSGNFKKYWDLVRRHDVLQGGWDDTATGPPFAQPQLPSVTGDFHRLTVSPPWAYTLHLPHDPHAPGIARATLRTVLDAHGLSSLAPTAERLASELLTNAHVHTAGPTPPAPRDGTRPSPSRRMGYGPEGAARIRGRRRPAPVWLPKADAGCTWCGPVPTRWAPPCWGTSAACEGREAAVGRVSVG
ncbi:Beta-galactosidase [Streptomyces alboniger]